MSGSTTKKHNADSKRVQYYAHTQHTPTFSGVNGSREPLITSDGKSSFESFPVGFTLPIYTTPLTHSGLASVN